MTHAIHQVLSFEFAAPFQLRVRFEDDVEQLIDFQPILKGPIFGPLSQLSLFNQVRLDPDVQTLVWPNGADFDPATLHDWPDQIAELLKLSDRWNHQEPSVLQTA